MTIINILNSYNEVKDDLIFQGTSNIQTKIMISLIEGPKEIGDLERLIEIPSSRILRELIELKEQNLIFNKGVNYYLSNIGTKITSELMDMIKTMNVLENNRKLWLNHEIDAIPQYLLKDISSLNKSILIEAQHENILKTHETHCKIMLKSKEIKGVCPIFYPDYIPIFKNLFNRNISVELILTEAILKRTIESLNLEDLKQFKTQISKNRLKIWKIKENVKVAFTITDKFITLGLCSTDGIYDSNRLLVSDHEDALIWGNKLFKYYLKKAQKVNLNILKDFKEVTS